ncbi:MAG TPA: DUF4431 domain-containing protein [Pyrinomonadaceae bacterium]|nr:DUF4431 domain-containing protein [Pyrinomonadaceae bacterium]
MRLTLLIAILLLVAGFYRSGNGQCLKYGPAVVTVAGTLRSQIFPGLPNYESIKRGDRKERAIIVTLAAPTCSTRNDSPQGLDDPETDIREMQLVVTKSAHWKTVERRLGKRVVVTGTLFHAHTGHHRTKVLIEVTNIRRGA